MPSFTTAPRGSAAPVGSLAALSAVFGTLSPRDRWRLAVLLSLMVLAALLDGVGVGAALPLAAAILQQDAGGGSPLARALYDLSRTLRESGGVPLAALLLFLLFAVKNTFALVVLHLQTRFVLTSFAESSATLLSRYVRAPWRDHARRSTGEILRNVVDDARMFYGDALLSTLFLATHLLALMAVLLVLLLIDWRVVALSAVAVGGVTSVFYAFVHARTASISSRRRSAKGRMNRWVHESLATLKEAKLGGRQAYFVDRYQAAVREYAGAQTFETVVRRAPRMLVEVAAVLGLAIVVVALHVDGRGAAASVPLMATVAVALSRLVPAIYGISSELVTLRQSASSVRGVAELDEDGLEPVTAPAKPLPFLEALEVESVRVRYPGATRDALAGVSLTVRAGEAVALVGPSGAGKTTLGDVILSLIAPDEGRVLVDGVDVAAAVASWRASVAYVPQRIHLLDDTVRQNVAFGLPDTAIDDDRVWWALREAELDAFVRSLPHGLDEPVGERGALFSGGQQQRLGIARALYGRPRLIVFDEATASLDAATERSVIDQLFSMKTRPALVVIAHRTSTVRRCDRVALLERGRLSRIGTVDEMLGEPQLEPLLDRDESEPRKLPQ